MNITCIHERDWIFLHFNNCRNASNSRVARRIQFAQHRKHADYDWSKRRTTMEPPLWRIPIAKAKTCLCKSIYCITDSYHKSKCFQYFRFYMQYSDYVHVFWIVAKRCWFVRSRGWKYNNNKCRQLKPSFHIHVSQYPFEIQYWLGCGFLSTWKCNANQPTTTTTTTPGGVLHTHKCTEQISYSQPNDISQQKILFCIDSRISGYWMIAKFMP